MAGLLAAAGVLDLCWVSEFAWPTGLDPRTAYLSELEADGVAHAWWFRGCFTGADALIVVAGALACRLVARRPRGRDRRWRLAGWAGLAGYGLAASVEDLSPMGCAPSQNAACRAALQAHRLSVMDVAHAAASTAGVLALLVSMAALTVSARRAARCGDDGRGRLLLARAGPFLLAAELAAAIALGLCILLDAPAGIAGRAELAVEVGWLVLLAAALLLAPTGTGGRPPPVSGFRVLPASLRSVGVGSQGQGETREGGPW